MVEDSGVEGAADGDLPTEQRTDVGAGGAADGATDDDATSGLERRGARDVVVPLSVYKVVTVFSTLIAVVAVVGGFMALDAATNRATLPPAEIDPVLAIVGLLAIAAGGGVFAFASRFRAPGMGTPKTDDDEGAGDG